MGRTFWFCCLLLFITSADAASCGASACTKQQVDDTSLLQNVHASTRAVHEEEKDPYDGAQDIIDAGISAITGAGGLVKDPSLEAASGAIGSLAGLAALVVPPPAGLVVSGVLGLVSGIMSIFGGGGPPQPSNQDILDAVNTGFDQVNKKLDVIDAKIDVVLLGMDKLLEFAAVMNAKLDAILAIVNEINKNVIEIRIENFMRKVQEINGAYQAALHYLIRANQTNHSEEKQFYTDEFVNFLKRHQYDFDTIQFNELSGDNVVNFMDWVVRTKKGDPPARCLAWVYYSQIVQAQMQMFWLQFMASGLYVDDKTSIATFKGNVATAAAATSLKDALHAYNATFNRRMPAEKYSMNWWPVDSVPGNWIKWCDTCCKSDTCTKSAEVNSSVPKATVCFWNTSSVSS